jgi:GNAT superfamily N-acetyltransferase
VTVSIEYKISPSISDAEIEGLLTEAWPDHGPYRRFADMLSQCLGHVGAYADGRLIGFVYVAWDGEAHAFLLDTMVRPEFRRRGVGTELVRKAAELAKSAGVEWLHVDYEPQLARFYAQCGFRSTAAGLVNLLEPK